MLILAEKLFERPFSLFGASGQSISILADSHQPSMGYGQLVEPPMSMLCRSPSQELAGHPANALCVVTSKCGFRVLHTSKNQ